MRDSVNYNESCSTSLSLSPSATAVRGRNKSCSTNLSLSSSVTFTKEKSVAITTGLGLCVNDRNNYLITIPSDITKDVVDFPFVITENNIPSSFWSIAETDNLILRDVTGDLLYGELVTLDTVNHKLELYVKIPYAFEGISRSFYLSVGEGTSLVGLTGTANAQSVWDENFVFVSHMNDQEGGTKIYDSTRYGNHGTKGAGTAAPTEVAGLVGKAQSFDYSDSQYVEKLVNLAIDDYCIECLINYDSFPVDQGAFLHLSSRYNVYGRWASSSIVSYQGLNYYQWHTYSVPLDNWKLLTFTGKQSDISESSAYADGNLLPKGISANTGSSSAIDRIRLGKSATQTWGIDADISETRISSTARGAGWISFTSSNLKNNSTSYSVTETSQTSPSRQVNYSRDSLANLSLTSIVTRTVNYAARMAITNLSLNPIVTRTVNYTRSVTTNLSFQSIVTAIKRGWVKVKLKLFKRSVKVKLPKRDIKLKIRRK